MMVCVTKHVGSKFVGARACTQCGGNAHVTLWGIAPGVREKNIMPTTKTFHPNSNFGIVMSTIYLRKRNTEPETP